MQFWRRIGKWIQAHPWTLAFLTTLICSPLILWSTWDSISAIHSSAIRALICVGVVVLNYVGIGLVLKWTLSGDRTHRGESELLFWLL